MGGNGTRTHAFAVARKQRAHPRGLWFGTARETLEASRVDHLLDTTVEAYCVRDKGSNTDQWLIAPDKVRVRDRVGYIRLYRTTYNTFAGRPMRLPGSEAGGSGCRCSLYTMLGSRASLGPKRFVLDTVVAA